MAPISQWLAISDNDGRALESGRRIAPYALLLLFVPMFCCDRQCEVLWLCVGLSAVAAVSLYLVLAIGRELRLHGERLTF